MPGAAGTGRREPSSGVAPEPERFGDARLDLPGRGLVSLEPRPGLEPGLCRLEGGGSSIEHAGRTERTERTERDSNPRAIVLQTTLLARRVGSRRAGSGTRTRIVSLEGCGPAVGRCPRGVESARLELASPGCGPGILPLKYDPVDQRGAKESNLLSGFWRPGRPPWLCAPRRASAPRAARRGVEPLSRHGQWRCDAGRITGRASVDGSSSGRNRTFETTG
jgi:hypothetical protein